MANNKNGTWSLALLRLILGITFFMHGYGKLFVAGGFKGTVGFLTAIGIPLAGPAALVVALVEFLGGIALILGIFTRYASVLLLIEMLVALFKVHINNGFFISMQAYGYEFALLLIGALVVILFSGPGKLALGKKFKNRQLS